MSLFGKFMAVLNFFGVIAVFIMALMVYSNRKAWQYTNYRHDLAMYGLPVNKDQIDLQDYQRSLDLGSKTGRTLTALFPSEPVSTQVEEVERIKRILDSKLAGVNANREPHMDMLAVTLLPLAQSNRERESLLTVHAICSNPKALEVLKAKMKAAYPKAVAAVKADPKRFGDEFAKALRLPAIPPPAPPENAVAADAEPWRPFEEAFINAVQPGLTKDFDTAFNEALDTVHSTLNQQYEAVWPEALGTKSNVSLDQQRHAIARLLVDLDDSLPKGQDLETDIFSSQAFRRVVNVIGLEEMNRELNAEALILTRISQEQDKEIERERTAFALWHEALISEAKSSAQSVAQQDDQLRILTEKVKDQKTLVAQRQKNVADATNELEARRKYTAEMIDIIRQMTDSIHKTRVEVRDANEVNQDLVKKMRELENKR
jgi:hypothetical protein